MPLAPLSLLIFRPTPRTTISIPYSSKLKSHLESLISCLSNLYEENKLKLAALGHIQLPTLKRTCVYKHTQLGREREDWKLKEREGLLLAVII